MGKFHFRPCELVQRRAMLFVLSTSPHLECLAKLFHGIAASASVSFSQAAYRGKPTERSPQSYQYITNDSPVIKSAAIFQGLPLLCPVHKTLMELTTPHSVWSELTNLDLTWESQELHPQTLIKACAVPTSLCTLPHLSAWPLRNATYLFQDL